MGAGATDEVVIPRFFRGPPDSGNGGYAAGVAAGLLAGPAMVRLSKPPPLDRPLRVVRSEDVVEVYDSDGDLTLRATRREPLRVNLPAIDLAAALGSGRQPPSIEEHAAPTCFVCGSGRPDGFRIFPSRLQPGLVAAAWRVPDLETDAAGNIREPIVWAVLDCPGGWSFEGLGRAFFPALISQSVDVLSPLQPGNDVIVLGWEVGREGRKMHAHSMVMSTAGTPLAFSEQTCYEVAATWAR